MIGRKKLYRCLMSICVILSMIISTTSCGIKKNTEVTKEGKGTSTQELTSITGVVTKNNISAGQLEIREVNSDAVLAITYNPTSKITDRFQTELDGSQVEAGQIYKFDYQQSDSTLVTAEVPEEVWEYTDVRKFSIDSDLNMMELAGEKYRYSGLTYIADNDVKIEAAELSSQDVLTVRGIGVDVYSAVVTTGHGYIRLKNYKDFIGGMAMVNNDIMVPITDNMLITVPEGTHRLILCKSGCKAERTAIVKRDEEITIDFKNCKVTAKNVGKVTFDINPKGADLYLNNTQVYYDKPVSLNYGRYYIKVSLSGYKTYSGILNVAEASKTIKIDLTEGTDDTPAPTATSNASATASPTASASSNALTKKMDSKHTITVSSPEGVAVYLDSVYKGLAPCTFTKIIGSQTITLSDTGYVTKSYQVDIMDDDQNVKLSFADLVKESTVESTPAATAASTTK